MESATIRCLPVATKVDPNASFTVHINSERFPIFSIDVVCRLLKYNLPVAAKAGPNAFFRVHINSERFPMFSIDGACGLLKYTKEAEFVPLNEEHPRTFIYFR